MITEGVAIEWLKLMTTKALAETDYVRKIEKVMYIEVLLKVLEWEELLPIEIGMLYYQLNAILREIERVRA